MGASLATANLLAVPISAVNMLSLYVWLLDLGPDHSPRHPSPRVTLTDPWVVFYFILFLGGGWDGTLCCGLIGGLFPIPCRNNVSSRYLMMQWSDRSGQRWLCAATAGSGCTVGFGMVRGLA